MSTTETLAGMHMTGRRVAGLGSDLAELEREDGALCTAIVLDEKFRTMKPLIQAVELARGFMEFPMVTGLVEMSAFSTSEGALVYPTGPTRSVTEILKYYRESGGKFSKRAALELLFLAGQVLQEAADTGPVQGVYSHGDLNPSRILVKEDGDVQIIGYGLPSPEVLGLVNGLKVDPHAESLAYAPPERLQSAPEDVTSDLYSLACIAVELITQSALFDGSVEDIKQAHIQGEGPQKIARIKRELGEPVADILTYCLHFDPRNRYADGNAFVQAVGALLEGVAGGESLEDCVKAVHARKVGRTLKSAPAAGVAGPAGSARGRSIRPPARPQAGQEPSAEGRWGKASRGRKEEEKPPEPVEEEAADRRRRRRRVGEEEEKAAPEPEEGRRLRRRGEAPAAEAPAPEPAEDEGRQRRRLRRGGEEEAATPAPAPAAEAPADDEGGRRRRLRRGGDEEAATPAPAPAAEAPAESSDDEGGRRRRLRRGGDEPAAETPAPAAEPPAAEAPADEEGGRRRRLRRGADEEVEVDTTEDDDSPRRRRLRRGSEE